MQVSIAHACGGAVQMALRLVHEGLSEERRICNSGEEVLARLGPASAVHISFHPYPTPPGNEPADEPLPATVRIATLLRFGKVHPQVFVGIPPVGELPAIEGPTEYPPIFRLYEWPYGQTAILRPAIGNGNPGGPVGLSSKNDPH